MPSESLQTLPFGKFLPDIPPLQNPGVIDAKNVLPAPVGYAPFPSFVALNAALPDRPLGARFGVSNDGSKFNFVGTETNLYQLNSGLGWDNRSKTSGYSGIEEWAFHDFGERMIAVAGQNAPVQYFDMGGTPTTFLDLPGSPPSAKVIGAVRDFVVLGDLGVDKPNVLAWSGFNNSEQWTAGVNQSGEQRLLEGGGRIQAIASSSYGYVWCETAIYRLDYVGGQVVFNIQNVVPGRGTPAPRSVVQLGEDIYYYDNTGFRVFRRRGEATEPIGANILDKWFLARAGGNEDAIVGVADPDSQIIYWSFRTTSQDMFDCVLAYDITLDAFTYAVINHSLPVVYTRPGYSIDNIVDILPGSLDDHPDISLDSPDFRGGKPRLQIFNDEYRLGSFSGSTPLTAEITTGDMNVGGNMGVFTRQQFPMIEGVNREHVSVSIGARDSLGEPSVYSAQSPVSQFGFSGSVGFSKYLRYRTRINGPFETAYGIEVFGKPRKLLARVS